MKIGSVAFMLIFFGLCIFIHELGHFLAAKWRKLHIVAFSIGFRKIWWKKINGVEYRIGCIPVGGYVDLPQIDGSGDVKDENGNILPKAKPLDRIIVAFAGPLFNMLFGLLLGVVIWIHGIPQDTPVLKEIVVESVQKEFLNESEQFEEKMKAKSVIHKELEEQGEISIPEVASKVFEAKADLREKFKEKIEKYNIKEDETIKPVNENTKKKFSKQQLMTDTGIEIKIPMEQYNSTDSIEFITNEDGTISVLIKNIGKITSK